ncbi:hypothetical protein MHU86_1952 [Fragilaria crotonensis]|nr:hypothetical protein MHU86_1952 [Fragilaria crotonensis]
MDEDRSWKMGMKPEETRISLSYEEVLEHVKDLPDNEAKAFEKALNEMWKKAVKKRVKVAEKAAKKTEKEADKDNEKAGKEKKKEAEKDKKKKETEKPDKEKKKDADNPEKEKKKKKKKDPEKQEKEKKKKKGSDKDATREQMTTLVTLNQLANDFLKKLTGAVKLFVSADDDVVKDKCGTLLKRRNVSFTSTDDFYAFVVEIHDAFPTLDALLGSTEKGKESRMFFQEWHDVCWDKDSNQPKEFLVDSDACEQLLGLVDSQTWLA